MGIIRTLRNRVIGLTIRQKLALICLFFIVGYSLTNVPPDVAGGNGPDELQSSHLDEIDDIVDSFDAADPAEFFSEPEVDSRQATQAEVATLTIPADGDSFHNVSYQQPDDSQTGAADLLVIPQAGENVDQFGSAESSGPSNLSDETKRSIRLTGVIFPTP